jgi:cytochrome oxidase Cu insertion factor (SCO1/SenC/PrrC family)
MSDDAMMEAPAWYSVSLTDVNTGDAFTINDLKGKVVLVETMAVWCSNCLKQQTQVKALHESLGMRDDFVSLGIDIDPNEDADKLASFTSSNGFDWKYVIAPAEVAREISSLYGAQFLSPPSTPMLIIDRKGVAHPLPFGIKSAEELLQALQPFLEEAM